VTDVRADVHFAKFNFGVGSTMGDTKALFDNLRNSADQNVVVAIEA
jgi:hypothetical protein